METTKETSKRVKRTKQPIEPIEPQSGDATIADFEKILKNRPVGETVFLAEEQPNQQETSPQPQQETPAKPTFEADNSALYRDLLLQRPGVPFISNMQEAVEFLDRYQKWNSKVQLAFK
jgi:hypothetical protein